MSEQSWSVRVVEKVKEIVISIRKMRQEHNIKGKYIPLIILQVGKEDFETAALIVAGIDLILNMAEVDEIQLGHEGDDFRLSFTSSSYIVNRKYANHPDGWYDDIDLRNQATNFFRRHFDYKRDLFCPDVAVIDIGYIDGIGWVVIEANEVNGSGIYNADPFQVLRALYYATTKKHSDGVC